MTTHAPPSLCPLLDNYLELVDDTEPPLLYHRWCFITSVAAMLNRRTSFPMATGTVYPNMFTILLGPPGGRKSTAISMSAKLLTKSGYRHIANGKTSAEQFLLDLKLGFDTIRMAAGDLDLSGSLSDEVFERQGCNHCFVQAGELQDFLGSSNVSFISQLTNLWDNPEDYPYRLKSGTMELLNRPTITLLGGATQDTFKRIFPIDVIGQGLLSRFILIHGAGARKRVFMPKPLDLVLEQQIVEYMSYIRTSKEIPETYSYTDDAYEFSRDLYESGENEITDLRFQHYAHRRNDHYIKLAMTIAAMNLHTQIELNDCVLANTILTYTEKFMPLALGEFGQDGDSAKTEYLYNLVQKSPNGLSLTELVSQGISVFHGQTAVLASHLVRLTATKRLDRLEVKGVTRYIVIERTVRSESGMVSLELLKEYRENPTFNTAHVADSGQAKEWELSIQLEEEYAKVKVQKKQVGQRARGIQIPTNLSTQQQSKTEH